MALILAAAPQTRCNAQAEGVGGPWWEWGAPALTAQMHRRPPIMIPAAACVAAPKGTHAQAGVAASLGSRKVRRGAAIRALVLF